MLFEQISADIMSAMKARETVRLQALRNIKKYFIEAKTAPGSNGELSDEAAMKILSKLAKQGRDTAQLYREQGRPDLAENEMAETGGQRCGMLAKYWKTTQKRMGRKSWCKT